MSINSIGLDWIYVGECRSRCLSYRRQLQAEDAAKVTKIVAQAAEFEESASAVGATSGGDAARLRGLPAVSRRTSGAVSGTDPVRALLAKERRCGA